MTFAYSSYFQKHKCRPCLCEHLFELLCCEQGACKNRDVSSTQGCKPCREQAEASRACTEQNIARCLPWGTSGNCFCDRFLASFNNIAQLVPGQVFWRRVGCPVFYLPLLTPSSPFLCSLCFCSTVDDAHCSLIWAPAHRLQKRMVHFYIHALCELWLCEIKNVYK